MFISENGPFQCSKCGKYYSKLKTMKYHFKNVCGQPPRFQCHICLKLFKKKLSLKCHTITIHNVDSNL